MTDTKENFNAVLEVTFSEHKQEIQALGKQYDSKVYALEAKLKFMRDQSYEECKRVESANARVVELESELQEVRSKMEQEMGSSIAAAATAGEAEIAKKQLEEVRAELDSSHEKFESELSAAVEARKIAESNLHAATEKISTFENEISSLSDARNSEMIELREQLEDMKASSALEQEQLRADLEESRAELESARTNFETDLNAAYEAQKSAESNVEELNEQIKSFESEISLVSDAKLILESELEEARGKLVEYESSLGEREQLQQKLDSARFELENSESKVAAAEDKLRETEAELYDLLSKNEELESSLTSNSESLRLELEESRAELESARANFETELNAAYEAQRSAESNVEEMNEQIKSYESELLAIGSLELQLDEAQAKLTAYEASSNEEKEELLKQLDSARFELENSESKVAAGEEERSEWGI